MPRATIDYMNARRAVLRHGTSGGGKTYSREAEQCPDRELDECDRLELECESKWSDLRINSQAYWDKVFAQFGLQQGYDIGETF